MMRQPQVLIAQRLIPTYRVPVFERLCASQVMHATVVYGEGFSTGTVRNAADLSTVRARQVPTWYVGEKTPLCFQPQVVKAINRRGVDVVVAEFSLRIVTNILAALLAQRNGVRFIWWGCGHEPLRISRNWLYNVKKHLLRALIQRADGVIAYSQVAAEYYASFGYPRDRITVAPNSVDDKALQLIRERVLQCPERLKALRQRLGFTDKRIILYIGRLIEDKRVDLLLEGFRLARSDNPSIGLVVVGDGPARSSLQQKAESIPDVAFVGAEYDRQVLAQYLEISDVFVLPGLGGLAINEAMCFGLPIICSQADGTEAQLVYDGQNGWILPEMTPENLAERIVWLVQDPVLAGRMGEESLRIIRQEVNLDTMVARFEGAIAQALSSGSA
jgi:glycosyltransferase involved in cell wall biosynthesis